MVKIDDLPAISQFPSSPRELAGKMEAREKRVSVASERSKLVRQKTGGGGCEI